MAEEHGLYQRGMRTIDEDDEEEEDYYVVYAVTDVTTTRSSFLSSEDDEAPIIASFRPQAYTRQLSLLLIMFVMIGYLATRGGEFAMAQQRGAQAVDVQSKSIKIIIASGEKQQGNNEARTTTTAVRRPPSSAPGEMEEDDIAPTAPIKIPKLPRDYHRSEDEEEQGEQDAAFPGPEMDLKLPTVWNVYRSVADTNNNNNITETDLLPVFFHLPKSGGSTIKDILLNCHIQAMASEVGVGDNHGQDNKLQLVHVKGQSDLATHVNVDVTTRSGLVRARSMGLVHSGLAQVIATPLLFESAAILFHDPNPIHQHHQGRVFAVFRHPIRRAVSMFAYLRKAYWEPTYRPEFGDWNIEHYALSDVVEDNFMVRQLAQVPDDMSVTEQDLEIAKAIISQKVLVGLLDRVEDSLVRFEQYFGWRYTKNPTRQETCRNTLLVTGVNTNTDPHNQMPEVASKAFQMLQRKNALDLLLYTHVERLFDYQAVLVENVPRDIRLINTTCALCDDGAQPDDPTTI